MTSKKYPIYQYTDEDARNNLARFVRLDNPDSYPFDTFHAHAYNEILVFLEGGGCHNINFKEYEVMPYAIHLLAANDLHWLERSMSSSGFVIVYKEQFLHKLQVVHPDINFHDLFNYSRIINLNKSEVSQFGFIINELLSDTSSSAYQLQIIGAFMMKVATLNSENSKSEKIFDSIIPSLIRLIDEHYKSLRTVSEYAQLLNVSVRGLQSRVKKASSHSVSELIQDRIMKEAKKMLCISGCSIKEIAYELGFKETAHFSNWFKKYAGCMPSEYKYHSY